MSLEGRPRRIVEIVLVVVILVGIPILLFPLFVRAREWSGPNDLSVMKQLATAGLHYASDNDDRAPVESDWMDHFQRYGRGLRHYVCVNLRKEGRRKKGEYGHALFSGIVDRRISSLPVPASFPFFFDSRNLSKSAVSSLHEMQARGWSESKSVTIAYADGHVKEFRPVDPRKR